MQEALRGHREHTALTGPATTRGSETVQRLKILERNANLPDKNCFAIITTAPLFIVSHCLSRQNTSHLSFPPITSGFLNHACACDLIMAYTLDLITPRGHASYKCSCIVQPLAQSCTPQLDMILYHFEPIASDFINFMGLLLVLELPPSFTHKEMFRLASSFLRGGIPIKTRLAACTKALQGTRSLHLSQFHSIANRSVTPRLHLSFTTSCSLTFNHFLPAPFPHAQCPSVVICKPRSCFAVLYQGKRSQAFML